MQYCYDRFCLTKVSSLHDYSHKTIKLTVSDIFVNLSETSIKRDFFSLQKEQSIYKKVQILHFEKFIAETQIVFPFSIFNSF